MPELIIISHLITGLDQRLGWQMLLLVFALSLTILQAKRLIGTSASTGSICCGQPAILQLNKTRITQSFRTGLSHQVS